MTKNQDAHWNAFYSHEQVPLIPSQFAAFVANEFQGAPNVLELGCGNGRDLGLFRQHGARVVAVDGSQEAVASCQRRFSRDDRVTVLCGAVGEAATWDQVRQALGPGAVTIYARFFLHAIDAASEGALLMQSAALLRERGGTLCAEFRTHRDEELQKVTAKHYRRFISPCDLIAKMASLGFEIDYFVEGYGFAKFKNDDAHVARIIAVIPA
jgi:SAM-dependent methyltransferase